MAARDRCRIPLALRCLITASSWIAHPRERQQWRFHVEAEVRAWWELVERGELTTRSAPEVITRVWQIAATVLWSRVNSDWILRFVRGPQFLFAVCGVSLATLAAISNGFSATRTVAAIIYNTLAGTPSALISSETVFVFVTPLGFALLIGLLLIASRWPTLHGASWRYWPFLATKIAMVLVSVPLFWIELSAMVRARMLGFPCQKLVTGFLFRLLFITVYVLALRWCMRDQQRRCAICLARLSLPVSIGTCASVFEPATVEFVCLQGHGTLSVPQIETGEPSRWTSFDASWSVLFEAPHTGA